MSNCPNCLREITARGRLVAQAMRAAALMNDLTRATRADLEFVEYSVFDDFEWNAIAFVLHIKKDGAEYALGTRVGLSSLHNRDTSAVFGNTLDMLGKNVIRFPHEELAKIDFVHPVEDPS